MSNFTGPFFILNSFCLSVEHTGWFNLILSWSWRNSTETLKKEREKKNTAIPLLCKATHTHTEMHTLLLSFSMSSSRKSSSDTSSSLWETTGLSESLTVRLNVQVMSGIDDGSFDGASSFFLQSPGSTSPTRKQNKESTVTVSPVTNPLIHSPVYCGALSFMTNLKTVTHGCAPQLEVLLCPFCRWNHWHIPILQIYFGHFSFLSIHLNKIQYSATHHWNWLQNELNLTHWVNLN